MLDARHARKRRAAGLTRRARNLAAVSGAPDAPTDGAVESPGAMLLYAPSWRERVVHYAHSKAPMQKYGRSGTVVAGLCGEIGWGPHTRPPDGWPMCEECIEIASEENS